MTKITQFSEAFWDSDFVGTSGFDALVKRLKEGRQMCREFEEYVRARSRVEEEYSKSILKLARNMTTGTELGGMKNAWDTLRSQMEGIAREHLDASNAMLESVRRISDVTNKQKDTAKQEEDNTRKAIKKKIDLYKKVNDACKIYSGRCSEKEAVDLQVSCIKAGGSSGAPRDMEKLFHKQSRTRQDAERADQHYRNCVDSLGHAHQIWEREHVQACQVFQSVEEERQNFLRNEMWVHVNIMSRTYADNDTHCESLRHGLDKCNAADDVTMFIMERKTGLERPAPVQYEPCIGVGSPGPSPKYHTLGAGRVERHPPPPTMSASYHEQQPPAHMNTSCCPAAATQYQPVCPQYTSRPSQPAMCQAQGHPLQPHQAHHNQALGKAHQSQTPHAHQGPSPEHHNGRSAAYGDRGKEQSSQGHSHYDNSPSCPEPTESRLCPEQARKLHIVEDDHLYDSVVCAESYASET